MNAALKFADFVDGITRIFSKIASVLLLALIALVFSNVAGRYVFGNPPIWMQELEWHLLVPISLLGIIVLLLENGHVRVDMIYERVSPKAKCWIDLISMSCGAAVALLFIKYSYGFVNNSFSVFEGSPDPGGLSGRWVLKGFIPVAFLFVALQCLANAVRQVEKLKTSFNTPNTTEGNA